MSVACNNKNNLATRPQCLQGSFARALRSSLLCCFALIGVAGNAAEDDGGWFDSITDWFNDPDDNEKVTPSHVYRATLDLIAEIGILREELGADDYPPEAEAQEDRAPVHVYAKTLEVMSKVSRVQRRLGMPATEIGQMRWSWFFGQSEGRNKVYSDGLDALGESNLPSGLRRVNRSWNTVGWPT